MKKIYVFACFFFFQTTSEGSKNYQNSVRLHTAAENGNLAEVKRLIEEELVDINAKNVEHRRALHYAAEKNYLEIAFYLILQGADTDLKDVFGFAPINYAKDFRLKRMILNQVKH